MATVSPHVGESGRLPQPRSSRIPTISLPKLSGRHVVRREALVILVFAGTTP